LFSLFRDLLPENVELSLSKELSTTCTYRSEQHELNIGKCVEEAAKPINSPRNKAKPSPKYTIQ